MAEAIWIIIFIPVVMWILSSLVRGGAEEQPQQGANNARKQPTAGDLDRFLEEVNRRRREAANREPSPPEVVPVQRRGPTPTVTAKPAPAPARPAPPRPRPAAPTVVRPAPLPARPTPARAALPTAVPVDVPVAMIVAAPVAQARPAMPKLGELAAIRRKRPVSPAAEQLAALLRTPDGLRTAILIREVFAPPVSKRRN